MSSRSYDPQSGALEPTPDDAEVKRSIAAGAERIVLAADASKLGARAVAVGLEWDQIDTLVTDLDPTDERVAAYREITQLL